MNVMIFDRWMAPSILKNKEAIHRSNLIAFLRSDGFFDVMKDRTGTLKVGATVSYDKLMIAMQSLAFSSIYEQVTT